MARRSKLNPKKRKRLEAKANTRKRRTGNRKPRFRYLVVCEGKATEPNYFNGLKAEIPRGVIDLKTVGIGEATTKVVRKAIALKQKAQNSPTPYDFVWAIYDKDEASNERYNEAFFLGEKESVFCGCSNESFELWLVLHFQNIAGRHSRGHYTTLLDKHLNGGYQKVDTDLFSKVIKEGNWQDALQRASKLKSDFRRENPAFANPCTLVFELVEDLMKYFDSQKS